MIANTVLSIHLIQGFIQLIDRYNVHITMQLSPAYAAYTHVCMYVYTKTKMLTKLF